MHAGRCKINGCHSNVNCFSSRSCCSRNATNERRKYYMGFLRFHTIGWFQPSNLNHSFWPNLNASALPWVSNSGIEIEVLELVFEPIQFLHEVLLGPTHTYLGLPIPLLFHSLLLEPPSIARHYQFTFHSSYGPSGSLIAIPICR